MIAIRLDFEAGRYHATPWGRHVNEGVVEWPPSPYRLLRCLYDVWQRKCSDLPESVVQGVIEALGSADPIFVLPKATPAHTRSYLSSNDEDPTKKNLVFDAFLAFDKGSACYVGWPDLELTEPQRQVLERLLAEMNYLGRSESWIGASLQESLPDRGWRCVPLSTEAGSGEVVPVAALVAPGAYSGKKPWMDALTTSSTEVLKSRASSPPLLRQVRYVLPPECIDADPQRSIEPPSATRVQAVLLALDSKVLPLVTSTLEVAEQIRTRLMGAHEKRMSSKGISSLFSGKVADGSKRLDHGHLFILPLADEHGYRIDRVLLVSRLRALSPDELDAVRGVRELWQSDGKPKVRCVTSWQGAFGDSVAFSKSNIVESVTPFVTVRHCKRRDEQATFLASEIRRECLNHGLPEPKVVQVRSGPGRFEAIEYRLNRKQDPPRSGYWFRLEFPGPVVAPFSLGYGCHFGLGQFGAAASPKD